ncbi:MAG: AAA family ATPase, partial [Nocardioides sp.]
MTEGSQARPALLAGRIRERGLLDAVIGEAAGARPGAVFVHGEAGVGKTTLVRSATEDAASRGFTVLWGSCLRFGAVASVLLPWVVALDRWVAEAGAEERHAVLDGIVGADQLLPSLGGTRQDGATHLAAVAETLLARVVARRPTMLVLDDVQWADAASRDVLSYVVAGFAHQRLVVLATCRDEGLPPGDPTFGWLADLRRMPSVTELPLDRLTRDETEEQLAGLLHGAPAPGLVETVHARSGGNAYLSELLVHGLDASDERLPGGLPADLATALLAAWHRLGPVTREALRVLAVAGRPVPPERLVDVCAECGLAPGDVRHALDEAVTAGTVVPDDGSVWLRHPLLAEVLYDTYLPGSVARVHRAWAGAC